MYVLTFVPSDTSYHLAVKTGDLPLAGTDANVFFQLVGDEGETEKIQLRQGGKAEKRFDRGRTDKFIVETVDVGQVGQSIGRTTQLRAINWGPLFKLFSYHIVSNSYDISCMS